MPVPLPEQCPPAESVEVEGVFYRFAHKEATVGSTTGAESWLRPYETRGSDLYKHDDECDAHGLSIMADREDIERARAINPGMRKKPVAEVTITRNDGKVLATPMEGVKSHHDWWTTPHDLIPAARVVEPAVA